MASAEAQARVSIALRDVVAFYEGEGLPPRSVGVLTDYLDRNLQIEFLKLCESYGKTMAFINQDELINRLYNAWSALLDYLTVDRKVIQRRLRFMKEDKKQEPANIQRAELQLQEADEKKAVVLMQTMRLKYMKTMPIDTFKSNPNFDYKAAYLSTVLQTRAANALLGDQKGGADTKPQTPNGGRKTMKVTKKK